MKFTKKDGIVFAYDESQYDLMKDRLENLGHIELSSENAIDSSIQKIVVKSITRAQGKAVLIKSGLWQGVVDFVNSISGPVEKAVAEVALNDTTHWQRTSPFLNEAANALGLTDEQLDNLFLQASKIEL